MDLTLSVLLEKYPAVAAEHAAKLTADKEKELAAAKDAGANSERQRITTLLSECKACHFAKTKEHPKGFVLHAIENGLSELDCLKGIMALNSKNAQMSALEEDSEAIKVGPSGGEENPLSEKQIVAINLAKAVDDLLKKGGE